MAAPDLIVPLAASVALLAAGESIQTINAFGRALRAQRSAASSSPLLTTQEYTEDAWVDLGGEAGGA